MNRNKAIVIILSGLLITTNFFWLTDKYRSSNRVKYNMTYTCEQDELIYCLRTFNIGITYDDFKSRLDKNDHKISEEWTNENHQYVKVSDILYKCPDSGRPYCGILFDFNNNELAKIEIGYPCH